MGRVQEAGLETRGEGKALSDSGLAEIKDNISLLEVLAVATRLGLTSFGGPIAHLGYFHEEYVLRRKWLGEKAYADLVDPLPVPAWPGEQPGGDRYRHDASRIDGRHSRLDRVHPAFGPACPPYRPATFQGVSGRPLDTTLQMEELKGAVVDQTEHEGDPIIVESAGGAINVLLPVECQQRQSIRHLV